MNILEAAADIRRALKYANVGELPVQAFSTRNIAGDSVIIVYASEWCTVYACSFNEYVEIFGADDTLINLLEVSGTIRMER